MFSWFAVLAVYGCVHSFGQLAISLLNAAFKTIDVVITYDNTREVASSLHKLSPDSAISTEDLTMAQESLGQQARTIPPGWLALVAELSAIATVFSPPTKL